MHQETQSRPPISRGQVFFAAVAGLAAGLALVWPDTALSVAGFIGHSMVEIAPLVIPGILLAGWIIASGADGHVARVFNGRLGWSILAAAAIGAITPVCGVTVLPLMAGLLAAGVPLAPVMAFWLSSPVTDPAMLATTAATLGLSFAIGKTVAAFGLGLMGGAAVAGFSGRDWVAEPLRQNSIVGRLVASRNTGCGTDATAPEFRWNTVSDKARRSVFFRQIWATTRLMLICLTPAFAAEYALNALLQPEALSVYLGRDTALAIPLAVFVGAPAYVDGYAALPLTRALLELGMSPGAALAFLISGGVVSIWGAMAIFPVLRLKPFFLYLVLAVVGSLAAGYVFEAVTS